ncbi:MAG: hypothetical protein ACREFR_14635 [Limisphaerales bacterium]
MKTPIPFTLLSFCLLSFRAAATMSDPFSRVSSGRKWFTRRIS